MGEETDGVVASVSKLQSKVMGLSGVNILTDSGAYKDTYTIIKEIAEVWDEMNDMDRAALLELLAGKNRSNTMAAMLTNLEDLEEAYESALGAEGSALQENEKYLDSIQGKVDQFTNAVQTMWSNLLDAEIVKFVVDLGTALVKLADSLGLVGTAAVALGAKFAVPKIFSSIKSSFVDAKTAFDAARGIVSTISSFSGDGLTSFLGGKVQNANISNITHEIGAEIISQKALNKELATQILLKNGVKENDIEGALAAMGYTTANTGLTFSFQTLGTSIKAATKAFLMSPFGMFVAVVAGIAAIVGVVDLLTTSFKEAKEQLKETSDELDGVRSEIKSLGKELEDISYRIDELNSKEKLSFTEEEELKNLESQKNELERIVALEEQRAKILRNQQVEDAIVSFEKDPSFKNEYDAPITDDQGNPTYEFVYDTTEVEATIAYLDQYQKQLEAAENEMFDAGEKLKAEEKKPNNDDAIEKAQEDYNRAQQNVTQLREDVETTNSELLDILSERNELYGDLDFVYGENLTDAQKEYNKFLEQYLNEGHMAQIKMNTTGNEPVNAFKEISSREFFADELEKIADTAGITGEALHDMWVNSASEEDDPHGLRAFVRNLIEAGIIADDSAESMQKIVDLSIMMSEGSSDAEVANKKLARSQKRLQYKNLAKEISDLTKRKGNLSEKEEKELKNKRKLLSSIASEIEAYDILGAEIDEIKQKYENLETAKTTDEERAYGDNLSDAVSTLIEGYQTTNLGTEAVESARNILIPESVYEGAKNTREKLDKEYEYLTETLGKFMKIEYDDDGVLSSVELNPNGTYTFLENMEEKGLMTLKDGIWEFTDAASHDLKELAQQAGFTEDVLYAFFTSVDEMNANRGLDGNNDSVFDHLELDTEKKLSKALQERTNAELALYDIKDANTYEYAEAVKRYQDSLVAYSDAANDAREDAVKFLETHKLYSEAQGEVNKLLDEYNNTSDESKKTAIEEQLKSAVTKLGEYGALLEEYGVTEFTVSIAMEQIDAEIEAVQSKFDDFKDKVEIDEKSGKYKVKSEFEFEFKEGTEDQQAMDKYLALLDERHALEVYLGQDSVDSLTVLQDISDTLTTIAEALTGITNRKWTINIGASLPEVAKNALDWISGNKSTSTTTTDSTGGTVYNKKRGNSIFYQGTAHADGSWGLKSSENNALVGELGTEMVVDPHTGRYYTVGDNGAEFVDLPKDAIIFNHRQTEEIFKNGHINSRGKAYVNGNAYYDGNVGGYVYAAEANTTATGGLTKDYETLGDSISDLDDDFEELFDWFEILVEEIDEQISLMEAQLENAVGIDAKKNIYGGIIDAEYDKIDAYTKGIGKYQAQANKFLSEIPAQYREMAKNGAIAITEFKGEVNEEVVEAINNYREWAQKAADLNQQLEETKSRISELRVETQSMIATEYENKIGLITHLNDTLEAEMDLLEESGERSSANFYNEMIKNNNNQLKLLQQERDALQKELDDAVKSGDVKKYSEDWYEMVNAVYEVDDAIIETKTSIESFNNSIQELHWENFEKIVDAVVNISDEAEHLRDLIDDTDITEELNPEQWSKDGLTALGLVAQQMENAKYRSELYAAEIEKLNEDFKAGKYTQDEYNEKLKELKDNQWDAIDAYESAKDAIIDLNKTRVEAIKDGIQKEIDAYEELINKRKEDLDSQKEAHDWAKTVADHQKTIDDIQRQIDAMEGDQSAAAAAARKKLQEELKEAQENYDEALYDHSIETQQKALDNSLETYKEEQEGRMDALDEWLENEEQVIAESYAIISANTEAIHQNIESISDTYGVKIEENVVKPWEAGVNALGTYGEKLDTSTSQYVLMLGRVKSELELLQKQADNTANAIIKAANTKASNTQAATKSSTSTSRPSTSTSTSTNTSTSSSSASVSKGQQVQVKTTATHFSRNGGNGTKMQSWVPGSKFSVLQTSGNEVLIGINGVATGWVKKTDLVGYAKGTTGVKSNQLAWIDENGLEEIVMHANNGRLTYLTKGSSVIPHDISENLMELGKVDPKTWLANNRRTTTPVSLTTNNNVIDLSFGSLINIEHADRDSIPEIQDAVKRQLDSYMKNINAGLKKFTR